MSVRTFGTLAFQGASWQLDVDPQVAMRAKRVFGRIASKTLGVLELSHSPEICRELEWFLERYPLALSSDDAAVLSANARAHRDRIARLEQIIDPSYEAPAFRLALPPRSYQAREAAIWLEQGGLLVGDDVGLGKTASAICGFTDPRTLPAVVVPMAHLSRQWCDEINKFAPELFVHIVKKGTPYELPTWFGRGPDVLVVNYHRLHGWAGVLSRYVKSVVFDEVQELRHSGTRRYDAARLLSETVPYRLGLSATPIHNYGGEIFNILDALKPGCLGTFDEFATEWCVGRDRRTMTLKSPKAFGAWAREQFLIVRHTRTDVGRELPAVQRLTHIVQSDERALDRIQHQAADLARIILSATAVERGARWEASQQLSVILRQATGIAKAPYVADFVRILVEQGEHVVLCGWHREVYEIWQAKLADLHPRLYTGTESATEKELSKHAFVTGQSPVLILSLRSGAGLDGLQTASSCIVFGELDWSPAVHEQAIGRLARDGQSSPVVAYFLMSEDGADPAIAENLGLKRAQLEGIRNPTIDFLERVDSSGDHIRKLATEYLRQLGSPPVVKEVA